MGHKMTKHIQRYEINDSKQVIGIVPAGYNRIEWNERPTEAKHSAPMILSSTHSFILNLLRSKRNELTVFLVQSCI